MDTEDPRERGEIGALIMQVKSVTTDSNHIQCTLCQKEMMTKDRILTHMKSHFGFKRREVTDQHLAVCWRRFVVILADFITVIKIKV